jgi:hypothetical protein
VDAELGLRHWRGDEREHQGCGDSEASHEVPISTFQASTPSLASAATTTCGSPS